MNTYRHGDLLIREIKKFPKNLKRVKNKILKEGEATGHHHRFQVDDEVEIWQDEFNNMFFEAKLKSLLTHEEHKVIEIAPALYEVIIEREFDPFQEAIKQVQD